MIQNLIYSTLPAMPFLLKTSFHFQNSATTTHLLMQLIKISGFLSQFILPLVLPQPTYFAITSPASPPSPLAPSPIQPPPPPLNIEDTPPHSKMTTLPNPKPNPKYSNSDFQLYTSEPPYPTEPNTISQALKNPSCRSTMQEEYNALQKKSNMVTYTTISSPKSNWL